MNERYADQLVQQVRRIADSNAEMVRLMAQRYAGDVYHDETPQQPDDRDHLLHLITEAAALFNFAAVEPAQRVLRREAIARWFDEAAAVTGG